METLVFAAHNRNHHQYCANVGHDSTKFDALVLTASENFRGISCRTFQSGAGLLPTTFKSFTTSPSKNAFSALLSPKTPSPSPSFNENKGPKQNSRSSTAPIPIKKKIENEGKFHFSERWAGPTYSNSPPPSSLPLPKFSLRPERTVSLDLPNLASEIDLRSIAKSAPVSPIRGRSPSPGDLFDPFSPRSLFESHPSSDLFDYPLPKDSLECPSPSYLYKPPSSSDLLDKADSATKALRRILNLDVDE